MTEQVDSPEKWLVVGGLATPEMVAEAARYVQPEDIEDKRLRIVWSAMVNLVNEGKPMEEIDLFSVAQKCAKGAATQTKLKLFMAELLDGVPRFTSLVSIAQRVRRRATLRMALDRMVAIGKELREQVNSNEGDVEDLDERLAQLSIDVASRSDSTLERVTYKDAALEVAQYFDRIAVGTKDEQMIPTGLPTVDRRLGGGLRLGQLHVIEGGTGAGKTALASQLCDSAVQHGRRAIMFSMEVAPIDVFVRDVERKAGRSRWDMRSTSVATREAAKDAIVSAQAQLVGKPGKIIFGEPISVAGIRQAILTERLRGGRIDLVVVDHAQVALPSADERHNMPRYLVVKGVAEGLRAIAKHLNVAVVLTAQLNPPAKGEKPSMHSVREGKDINNASEVVIVIWHEEGELSDGETFITASYLLLDKVRAGTGGKVKVKYRGECYRFEEPYQSPAAPANAEE